MTPTRILLAERFVLLAGFVAVVVAIAAVDWRAGLLIAGLGAIASTSPWRNL